MIGKERPCNQCGEPFVPERSSGARGIHCLLCNRKNSRERAPYTNAVARIAYKLAGGFRQYNQLARADRLVLRDKAKQELGGVSQPRPASRRAVRSVPGTNPEFDQKVRRERAERYEPIDRDWDANPEGYVYIACQKGNDLYLKIGHSRSPKSRTGSVNTFLAPEEEYEVVHQFFVADRFATETAVFKRLKAYRIGKKELFYVTPAFARRNVQEVIDG